jgi:hypothetical protein
MNQPEARGWIADRGIRCVVTGLSLLLALPALAVADEIGQLMSLLAQHRNGHVQFIEQHFVALLDRPVESSGELFYVAPDKLEKRTLKPRKESMLIERGLLKAQVGSKQRTVALQTYPELAAFIESIRATLAGDLPALQKYFSVRFSGTVKQWELELTPIDARLQRTIRLVRIKGSHHELQLIEGLQADGDRSVMSIRPIQ